MVPRSPQLLQQNPYVARSRISQRSHFHLDRVRIPHRSSGAPVAHRPHGRPPPALVRCGTFAFARKSVPPLKFLVEDHANFLSIPGGRRQQPQPFPSLSRVNQPSVLLDLLCSRVALLARSIHLRALHASPTPAHRRKNHIPRHRPTLLVANHRVATKSATVAALDHAALPPLRHPPLRHPLRLPRLLRSRRLHLLSRRTRTPIHVRSRGPAMRRSPDVGRRHLPLPDAGRNHHHE